MTAPTDRKSRRDWRLCWLSSLQAYGDRDAHRRWPDPNDANPYYSYIECAAGYFVDCGLADGYGPFRSLGYVTDAEMAAVAGFDEQARSYEVPGRNRDDAAIVADKGWETVVTAAEAARDRLLPLLSGQEEVLALTQPRAWEEDELGLRCSLTSQRYVLADEDEGVLAAIRRMIADTL